MLDKEDYIEPQCPFCTDQWKKEAPVRRIPRDRVLQKLDEHFSRNDYDAALRHLKYWLQEAVDGRDGEGELLLTNELMGIHRKLGKRKEAIEYAEKALTLVEKMDLQNETAGATAFVNAATVYKAFQMAEKSIPLFEKALPIYERNLKEGDGRLGGLYNNMGLALVDLKEFAKANASYQKALAVMEKAENGELDLAITWLNMANAAEDEKGLENAEEEIEKDLEIALSLLNSPNVKKDGYYAFVCEKCAPTFGYYGRFYDENDLMTRAKEIYERS